MKHLPENAVRMNYEPVIAEYVTHNFFVYCIAREIITFGRRMTFRDNNRGQHKLD